MAIEVFHETDETKALIAEGLTPFFSGEHIYYGGEKWFIVYLGEDYEDTFNIEYKYIINLETLEIKRFDEDTWDYVTVDMG